MEATDKSSKKREAQELTKACNPDNYAHLIGQDRSVLDGMTLPERTRILRPGAMKTMDYIEQRLNFYLDASGKIEKIICG